MLSENSKYQGSVAVLFSSHVGEYTLKIPIRFLFFPTFAITYLNERMGLLMKKALYLTFAVMLSTVLVACNISTFPNANDEFTPDIDDSGRNDNGQSPLPPGYTSADTARMPQLDNTPDWVEITFLADDLEHTPRVVGKNTIYIHDTDIIEELVSLYHDAEYVETGRPVAYPGLHILFSYDSLVAAEFTIACNQTEDGVLMIISGRDLGQGNKLLTSTSMFDYIKDLWEDQFPFTRVAIEEFDGRSANALETIYEDEEFSYSLSSIRSHDIVLAFIDGSRITLKDAIDLNIVNIHDLIYSGLHVYIDAKPGCAAMTYSSFYTLLSSEAGLIPADVSMYEESFFTVAQRIMTVSGESLSVYEFPSAEAMETNAGYISKSGFGISFPGSGVEISWVSDPYWFKSGIIIVNYVGENQEILEFLQTNLVFFAGHGYQ